jgi:hypothetical protein
MVFIKINMANFIILSLLINKVVFFYKKGSKILSKSGKFVFILEKSPALLSLTIAHKT